MPKDTSAKAILPQKRGRSAYQFFLLISSPPLLKFLPLSWADPLYLDVFSFSEDPQTGKVENESMEIKSLEQAPTVLLWFLFALECFMEYLSFCPGRAVKGAWRLHLIQRGGYGWLEGDILARHTHRRTCREWLLGYYWAWYCCIG